MYKVLLVDDMEYTRRKIKRFNIWGESSGFIVAEEAENGLEALEKLLIRPVDVVITDIRMPIINGIELVKKIYEKKLSACVIVLSDYTDFDYVREGFTYGAFDYLKKPLVEDDFAQLLKKVKQYLEEMTLIENNIKNLEKMAANNLETFSPRAEIELIIEYLEHGDKKAVEEAGNMIAVTSAALHDDFSKTALVIHNALKKVIDKTFEHNRWIDQFIDLPLMDNMCGAMFSGWEELENCTIEIVDTLLILMTRIALRSVNDITIRKLCNYVLENTEEDLSVKAIADNLFISRTYLSWLFKEKTNLGLNEYLTMIKLERAKKMVRDGILKNYEIAGKLGFKDTEYFHKLFKAKWGMTPNQYRNQTSEMLAAKQTGGHR